MIAAVAHNLRTLEHPHVIGLPNQPVHSGAARRREPLAIPGSRTRANRRCTLLLLLLPAR